MNIPKLVAKARLVYHANMLDVNSVLNQLHIISDEKHEESNRKHAMTIFTDIFPIIYGQDAVDALFGKEEE